VSYTYVTEQRRTTRRRVLQATGGALAGAGIVGALGSGTAAAAGGDVEWTYETGPIVKSSPTVADGTVFVGSVDNSVYALDAANGGVQWTYKTGESVNSSPTVAGGTVFVGSEDNSVYALDAGSGEVEWAFTQPSGSVNSSPTVVGGTVYVGSRDKTLYALDAATGEQEWAFTQPLGSVDSSPTVVDGTVYVGSKDDTLYAVDAATGEQEWPFTQPSRSVFSSPTVSDGIVYGVASEEALYAVDVEAGRQEWAFSFRGALYSSPTVYENTVYVGSRRDVSRNRSGALHGINAESGVPEWSFPQPRSVNLFSVDSSPTVVADPESGNSVGSRVMLGTLGHHGEWRYADQSINNGDGFGPGFGVSGALAGLGGAGYLLKRRLENGEE